MLVPGCPGDDPTDEVGELEVVVVVVVPDGSDEELLELEVGGLEEGGGGVEDELEAGTGTTSPVEVTTCVDVGPESGGSNGMPLVLVIVTEVITVVVDIWTPKSLLVVVV